MLQQEMKSQKIKFKSLAPTNKACRIINGETVHKFASSHSGKAIRDLNCKYIIIDEVSMMSEHFYKYFIVVKRMRPDIKFILSGDFNQLLPVKERIENPDYKNSLALYELCDGQRLQLTKCRRSDRILFDLVQPENIMSLTKAHFGKKMTNVHLSFTNKKRIAINEEMMLKAVKANNSRKQILKLEKLSYDDNSQDVKLLSGMPIIARKNSKASEIANNETFTIKEIQHKKQIIVIEDDQRKIKIPFKDFQYMFYVAYCITCHKAQGETYNQPYTIHEFNRFDERLRYVSLSRATDISLINII
jgi:ATP-dependent exoDNAse (exonuclease V) alpha subunit